MSSKENILARLRQNTHESFEKPSLDGLKPISYDDPVAEFITKTTTTAGAKLIELKEGESLNDAVRKAYPEAKIVASNMPGVDAQLNPDTVAEAQDLMKVDVGVIEGCIGVAENACIWVPQTMKEKAICFASEQLVIVLRREGIVNNMHEAYERLASSPDYFTAYNFGTFISGPSKTADIESALVYGAQAARGVTVVLI